MHQRDYHRFFNTHTISGNITCELLYVILFDGSFSFFKDEISAWQQGVSYDVHQEADFPYESLLDSLDQEYGLAGRDLIFYFYPKTLYAGISLSPSKDTLNAKASESRSEEHTSELQSLMRISYAVFCLKKK